ncbi:MAG: polysaccharide deacetylase family protein, partial [Candidatus Methanoperedens sp.]
MTIEFTATMKVDAYTPVTYTCCINYTYSEGDQLDGFETNSIGGVQIDNFENLSNWTIGGTGASYQADLINFKEGNQGLKLIATNGNRAYADKAINNNFSNTNNFAIWLYIENASSFRAPVMYITSTGTAWSKYFSQQMFGSFKTGWNKLIFDKSSFSNTNGESWNNVMNRIRITIYPNTGQNTNGTFDDLRYDVNNDWIGPTQEADTVNFKEGQQGLKLIGINGTTAYTDKTINNNFSNTNNFVIWLYIENASNTDYITIYLTSSGSLWTKYFYDLSYRAVKTGWNRFVLNKQSFVNNGGESWNNVMNRIRVRMYPITGENANITLDDLRYNITGQRAKLMIEFDDGETNVLTEAYPVLSANNQTGVSYVIPEYVLGNDRWYMTLDNLRTLQNGGWDISSHTMNHTNLAEANDSYQTYALNSSYDWLVANKFQKSAGFIAYPYGTFNDQTIEKVKKRYILGRATKPESYQQHFTPTDDAIMYIQRTVNVYNDTPVQTVKDQINDTINAKLLGKVVFHTIADSNPVNDRYTYLTSDFKKISDYIKSQSANIDVITNSEYVIPNIKNFTPVINKTTRIYSNGSSALITKNKYDEYMPNMTVKPSSGSIDINITTYNESGGTIGFSESSPESNLQISYSIGDRIPNKMYDVKIYWINGTKYQDFNISANNTGYINYNSAYVGSRYQEIVINNLPLSIISSLPVTDPTTTVGTSQSFEVYLNRIANITWYINGSMVQTNSNADSANYTNSTADIGIYNISATANIGLDSVSRTWNWSVNPRPNASFRFIVWADTKQGTSILTNESIIANSLNPAFTIYSGDLIDCESYENPTCFSNGFSTWKTAFNGGGTNNLFSKTFATRGNHDANTDTPWQSNFDFADTATRLGATNYSAQTMDITYSFDYANWHFVGLDAAGEEIGDMLPSVITWLDNDLTAAESRGMMNAFLFWHWPVYNVSEPVSLPPAALITVLNKHPIISAGFFGHEHLVAYTHIDSSRIPTITHPFEEFVSGAAGAELHDALAGKYDYWLNDGSGNSKSGFMAVDVSGNNFIVSVYNVDGSVDKTLSFTTSYIPPAPAGLASIQGNFWVNHTWQPGTGNRTDSYNISVNGSWTNGTDITYSNNSVGPHGWSNISVYAYNNSGIGKLNTTSASQNIQVANNIPIQAQIGNKAVTAGTWLNFTVSATDADSDPLIYGSNNSKGILNTSTGNYSWQPSSGDAGQYVWYFNSSDNFNGVDTETIIINVNAAAVLIPPAPLNITAMQGNFWINHSWQAGTGNVTDSFNVSVNGIWTNGTTSTYNNTSVLPHGWSNITVWAYNNSGTESLSLSSVSQNTQLANNMPVQTPIGDRIITAGDVLSFNVTATDADSDPIAYSTNATNGTLNSTTG